MYTVAATVKYTENERVVHHICTNEHKLNI